MTNGYFDDDAINREWTTHGTETHNMPPPPVTSYLPRSSPDKHLVIPGPRETAVREYCKWLESRATDEAYKTDVRKVCQVTLENRLDLELILEDPDSGFFVQRGIQIGTVRRFLRDFNEWATMMKSPVHLGPTVEEILDDAE